MKRILLTALTLASVTSFAQLKPGPPGGHHGGNHGPNQGGSSIEIQQIQLDIQSTRLSLQNALASLKTNPKLSANNIQQAMMRLDSISNQVYALKGSGPQQPEDIILSHYVTLKSSGSGQLFAGEGLTKLQAIENAQKACISGTNYMPYCQTEDSALTTETITSNPIKSKVYCSLKSSGSGKSFGAEGRVKAEATLNAQKACISGTNYMPYCQTSNKTVTCE